MEDKPKDPHSLLIKRILKKVLPSRMYQVYFGRHENGSIKIWSHIAAKIETENVIFDVGAFHGDYSIAARKANPFAKIVAFEPNTESATELRLYVEGYDIAVEEVALSSRNGYSAFENSSRTSHLVNDVRFGQVQIVRMDDYCHNNDIKPGLIKIDTEGSESDILVGGKWVLEECKPAILCEILSNSAGKKVMDLLPKDYLYYHIDENKGVSEAKLIDRKNWRNMNWLFLPESKKGLLDSFVWNFRV